MCGIAGIFHADRDGAVSTSLLRHVTTALRHRGPDGDGFHTEPGIGLGQRRLAIIDIEGGAQPMFNEDGTTALVFNGMIYNFKTLRAELQALGHTFRTLCDTEVIIHGWESWGIDVLQRLEGFFAIALWDRTRETLFLARDRLGKKPLHYARTPGGGLVFASEPAALLDIPGIDRRIDPAAVDDFLAFGYVPDPRTIHEGISRLPPGHFLLLDRKSDAQPRRWWDVSPLETPATDDDAVAGLSARLRTAVDKRMVADVPLGAFLSGGVDSSGVVAVAANLRHEANGGPLDTFTIGFEGATNETHYAETLSRRYATTQHSDRASLDDIDAAREQAAIFGEPFGDSSSVPTRRVCALARRYVTVSLSGDGGDEVFAGYRRYRWHLLTEGVRRHVPALLRRRVIGELARIYPKLDRAPRWLRAKHTLTEISLDSAIGYYRMVARIQHAQRRALFTPAFAASLDGHDPTHLISGLMERAGTDDALRQAQYADLHSWLPGGILTKVDRAAMACSLEVRAPFLDHEMVQWGYALPAAVKLRHGEGKRLLKKALEPLVPHELLYRPKQGFVGSLAAPFRQGAGRIRARLLGPAMLDGGIFDPAALARMIDQHASGAFDHSQALWLLLVFEGFLSLEQSRTAEAAA